MKTILLILFLVLATPFLASAQDVNAVGSTVYTTQVGLAEASTPVARDGFGKVYTKEDNILYFQDGAGTENSVVMQGDAISGTTGTFSGAVSGTTGTFTGIVEGLNVEATDTQVTAGSGTGVTVVDQGSLRNQVYVVTVDYTALSAAATSATKVIGTLPAGAKIVGMIADTTTEYTGGTTSAGTLIVGISGGDTDAFLASHDIFTAAIVAGDADAELGASIIRSAAVSGGYINWSATTDILVTLALTGDNTENLTQGSTTYYIETVQVK